MNFKVILKIFFCVKTKDYYFHRCFTAKDCIYVVYMALFLNRISNTVDSNFLYVYVVYNVCIVYNFRQSKIMAGKFTI